MHTVAGKVSAHDARGHTQVLISQMDVDRSGFVRYEDWLAAMLEWRSLQERDEWDAWVGAAFEAFNVDGTGRVGVPQLQAMLCKDGVCAMPDVVAAALRCAPSAHASPPPHAARTRRPACAACRSANSLAQRSRPSCWQNLARHPSTNVLRAAAALALRACHFVHVVLD